MQLLHEAVVRFGEGPAFAEEGESGGDVQGGRGDRGGVRGGGGGRVSERAAARVPKEVGEDHGCGAGLAHCAIDGGGVSHVLVRLVVRPLDS
jgi:hypothetical protein